MYRSMGDVKVLPENSSHSSILGIAAAAAFTNTFHRMRTDEHRWKCLASNMFAANLFIFAVACFKFNFKLKSIWNCLFKKWCNDPTMVAKKQTTTINNGRLCNLRIKIEQQQQQLLVGCSSSTYSFVAKCETWRSEERSNEIAQFLAK